MVSGLDWLLTQANLNISAPTARSEFRTLFLIGVPLT